jgi:adenine phosphoribosyltransferase
MSDIQGFKQLIRDVPDFPKPGIVFKDITPLISQPSAFAAIIGALAERVAQAGAEEILAIESRGFIFGAAVANELRMPLQLVRKPGKLPSATVGLDYDLEYGSDRVEVHREVIQTGRRYAIVDDLIATGGTAEAVARLIESHGGVVACAAFVVELKFLPGRERLARYRVEALLSFD